MKFRMAITQHATTLINQQPSHQMYHQRPLQSTIQIRSSHQSHIAPPPNVNVNVITQGSENVTQQLDFLSTPTQETRDTFQTHQHYYTEEWLYNHNETESSPLLEPSTVAHVPTPTNHLPIIEGSDNESDESME